jgi:hypothetical protein
MSYQTIRRWSSRTIYTILGLIIALVTAVSTALLVPPAWWNLQRNPASTQQPEPVARNSAVPSGNQVIPIAKQQTVCGLWQSESSQKKYDFVCQGQSSFQVHEIGSTRQNNTGSGTIREDGQIQAEMLITKRGRTAHLRLHLSNDGQKIEGSWYGGDAKESGTLSFHRVQ